MAPNCLRRQPLPGSAPVADRRISSSQTTSGNNADGLPIPAGRHLVPVAHERERLTGRRIAGIDSSLELCSLPRLRADARKARNIIRMRAQVPGATGVVAPPRLPAREEARSDRGPGAFPGLAAGEPSIQVAADRAVGARAPAAKAAEGRAVGVRPSTPGSWMRQSTLPRTLRVTLRMAAHACLARSNATISSPRNAIPWASGRTRARRVLLLAAQAYALP